MSRLLGSLTFIQLYRFIAGNGKLSSVSVSSSNFFTNVIGETAGCLELGVELVRSSSDVESLFELKQNVYGEILYIIFCYL